MSQENRIFLLLCMLIPHYDKEPYIFHPDMTSTDLYRNADFKEDEDMAAHLEPQEVAQTVEYIINIRDGASKLVLTISFIFAALSSSCKP